MIKKISIKNLRQKFNYYRDHQRYTQGILILRECLENNKEDKDVCSMLAEFLDKRGIKNKNQADLKESEAIYNKLIKNYPEDNSGYFGKIRFLLRRKDKKAFLLAKKYVKISGDKAYNMYIGHCYKDINDFKNAEKYYLLAYNHIKNHYGPDYALATLYYKFGDYIKAKEYAVKGVAKFKKMPHRYHQSSLTKKFILELKKIIKQNRKTEA